MKMQQDFAYGHFRKESQLHITGCWQTNAVKWVYKGDEFKNDRFPNSSNHKNVTTWQARNVRTNLVVYVYIDWCALEFQDFAKADNCGKKSQGVNNEVLR